MTSRPEYQGVQPVMLPCDGSIVEKSDYPKLYEVLADTYGWNKGPDQFLLPDLRGQMPLNSTPRGVSLSDGPDQVGHKINSLTGEIVHFLKGVDLNEP